MRKVVAHGEPSAFGPVRDRQDGRDGGVVRGVPVYGVGEPGGSLFAAPAEAWVDVAAGGDDASSGDFGAISTTGR